jgi:hypothetical protein
VCAPINLPEAPKPNEAIERLPYITAERVFAHANSRHGNKKYVYRHAIEAYASHQQGGTGFLASRFRAVPRSRQVDFITSFDHVRSLSYGSFMEEV